MRTPRPWRGRSLAIVLLAAALAAPAAAVAGDWTSLPTAWSVPRDASDRWTLGAGGPTPIAALPIDRVRGRWLRLTGVASAGRHGSPFGLNAWRGSHFLVQGLPPLCDGAAEGVERCTTMLWVPNDATGAYAFVAGGNGPGIAHAPQVAVAVVDGLGPSVAGRSRELLALLHDRYYRSDEVDWADVRRAVDAMPPPPAGVDPVPIIMQWLRGRLPGHEHLFVVPSAAMRSQAATFVPPTCGEAGSGVGLVTLPGLSAIEGDAMGRYTGAAHDCLMQRSAATAWVVDLRGNGGGNMYPMIRGIAPLLPEGRLYAFVDGHGAATQRLAIHADGLHSNDVVMKDLPTPDVAARSTAPVVVVFGRRCGSACEQVANALAARPRTLFVGEATAGLTSADVVRRLDDDYSVALTVGYTADPCGRPIRGALQPDVAIAQVDDRRIADVLKTEAVAAWLARTASLATGPVSQQERDARCTAETGGR